MKNRKNILIPKLILLIIIGLTIYNISSFYKEKSKNIFLQSQNIAKSIREFDINNFIKINNNSIKSDSAIVFTFFIRPNDCSVCKYNMNKV